MKASGFPDRVTGRLRRLRLTAETFEEERVLKMIFDGLTNDGTLFELTRDGESQGSFRFDNCREEEA